ncbi:hypothetical protein NEPAR06_1018 [Nematocida parisii]|uniref:Uncharacterized protein n=1 Tax=Nematocida parisii (strain ERTm3) TaxID=935791 RepID=I3EFN8_NEMP3|nr:hypothetical protein NEQG_01479 [Nematocida parisii ERTm3]KAI5144527.1 hypothetical protein NEPAR07_1121 [Nematocida parisii]KAI5154292.1 hypothetical protein NEPAR06_1018 [Nematocida parisii]KAI5157381.1 hypothetical protein NEPAR05_1229 [Nematocida parisii]
MMQKDFQSILIKKLDMNIFNTLKKNTLNVADTLLAIFSGSDPATISFDSMDGSLIKNRKEGDGIIYIFFKGIAYFIKNCFLLFWISFLRCLCLDILTCNAQGFIGILQNWLGEDGSLITGLLSFFFWIIVIFIVITNIIFFFKGLGMVYTRISKGKGWPILGTIIFFITAIIAILIMILISVIIKSNLVKMAYESKNFLCNIIGLFLISILLYIIYIELMKSLEKPVESISKTERRIQISIIALFAASIIFNVFAFIFAIGHLFRNPAVIIESKQRSKLDPVNYWNSTA